MKTFYLDKSINFTIILLSNILILTGCERIRTINNIQEPSVYYFDSLNGNDFKDGKSESGAWRSAAKINSVELNAGDKVFFRRGSEFTGSIIIKESGTPENPIIITCYGDEQLPPPSFTNPVFDPEKGNFGNCIRIKGSYIIVEKLYCHHTVAELPNNAGKFLTMWELGAIYIDKGAENCVVRNNEIFDCGVGIKSYGQFTTIENNYIHDCNRVLKQWSWGPIAIWLGADYQEVCSNRIKNYSVVNQNITWGPDSYGGGADGGAIEIDDARFDKSNIHIHHNFSSDCQGFIEVTWTDVEQHPAYGNFSIHHNVSDDFQQFIALWQGKNCRIENNTIIRRKVNANEWGVFNITQINSRNQIRNNIVVTENDVVIFNLGKNGIANPDNIIENNLYWAASGELKIGLEGPGEPAIIADPLFSNYSEGASATDFSLTKNSPAIDMGMDLGYRTDFNKTTIPRGAKSDIGAFEF
ncbi:MAG: hypothetical protein JXR31_07125 [Prolixibacteraceae bacterium]|nr:hypothetical protein [Prolixibacteraceae bacterium]MBN2774005.1 hypothetical protein [Prolixibacteraceae bacterium]